MFYPGPNRIAEDLALYRGTWTDHARHWIVEQPFSWLPGLILFLPETLGLMLVGMATFKSGFLTGSWPD